MSVLGTLIQNFGRQADLLGEQLGVDSNTMAGFDAAISQADANASGEDTEAAWVGFGAALVVVAAIGPELLAAGGAAVIG